MNISQVENVHNSGLVEGEMSRSLFGYWPRRALLKLTQPVKDWPLSCKPSKENRSTEFTMV